MKGKSYASTSYRRSEEYFEPADKHMPKSGKWWHRFRNESAQEFSAFNLWLEIPIQERSIAQAIRIDKGSGDKNPPNHQTHIFRFWALGKIGRKAKQTRPHWVARNAAYLDWLRNERDKRILEFERLELDDYMGRTIAQHAALLDVSHRLTMFITDVLANASINGERIALRDVPQFMRAAAHTTSSAMDGLSEAYGINDLQETIDRVIDNGED